MLFYTQNPAAFVTDEMAPSQEVVLAKDMTFENIMHKKTATTHEGFSAMLKKDKEAQQAAVSEYFQHWDNKEAKSETEADRAVSVALSSQHSIPRYSS